MTTRKKLIAFLVLLALALGGGVAYWRKSRESKVVYRQVPVERGEIAITILSTGVVQPENRVEIKPPIAGRAEQVLVEEGQRVKKGQILAWMSSTERAALLDAARARGPEELRRWEDLYRPTPIIAPINGTIIARTLEPGQTFATADPILVMSDRLTVQAQVDETDISQVRIGQDATVTLDAYPKSPIRARVDKIAFEAKTVNNVTTYVVNVLPDTVPAFMRSGMTANVTFRIAAKSGVLILPTEAIKEREGRSTVMISAGQGEKPLERDVRVGLNDGKRAEIISGLEEGDTVLAAQFQLGSGKTSQGTSPFSPIRGGGSRRGGR